MDNRGRRVTCEYVGTLDDGTVFDSSKEQGEPIEFLCGAGQVIDGFEKAVMDMEIGETKKVHIPVEEAYGEHSESNIVQYPVDSIPNGRNLPIGSRIVMQGPEGFRPMLVVSIEDDMVTMDLNHPLAGQALNFEITLIKSIDTPEIQQSDGPMML